MQSSTLQFALALIRRAAFAIMALVCSQEMALAQGSTTLNTPGGGLVTVSVSNKGAATLYVAFTVQSGAPGPITWSGCTVTNNQAILTPGPTCTATVPNTAGVSRFCASTQPWPTGQTPNCWNAQRNNQTLIETNFTSGTGCYPTNQASCVWYDISVIPENCTNCDWQTNNCNNAGGVSYNVPVQLACSAAPTFTCQGPVGPIGSYNAQYPTKCGTVLTQPNCVGGPQSCLQAYFFPMFTSGSCPYPSSKPQPNAECLQGNTLVVNFLSGP